MRTSVSSAGYESARHASLVFAQLVCFADAAAAVFTRGVVPLWRLAEYWATRQYDRMVIDCSGLDGYAPALARALVAYAAEHARMRKIHFVVLWGKIRSELWERSVKV